MFRTARLLDFSVVSYQSVKSFVTVGFRSERKSNLV